MRPIQLATLATIICALAGCLTKPTVVQVIDTREIQTVKAEIKRQVGVYVRASHQPVTVIIDKKPIELSTIQNAFWCGSGKIDFDIASVKVELTVTNERITDQKLGLSIPVQTVKLGASLEDKSDVTNAEVLDYNLWMLPARLQTMNLDAVTDIELQSAPIARVLLAVRTALILSATKKDYSFDPPKDRKPQPCFADFNPDKPASDAGNTYKIGLSINSDSTNGVSIDAGIITVGATGETKSTTGNSLTVSFIQRDLQQIQLARDAVDAECKYPNERERKCTDARDKLNGLLGDIGIGISTPKAPSR